MKLHNPNAEIFVPDRKPVTEALSRVTHLGIGAHQDDLEFMAFHGILSCYNNSQKWFGGVTCTNGSGSSRTGPYASTTDQEMMQVRRKEQNAAAVIGQYGVMVQLDYPSSAVKSPSDTSLKSDLKQILSACRPEIVYTHNLADKHDTHIGVVVTAIQAMRELPKEQRPAKVWGCEIWRGLDWMNDSEKILMDVSGRDNLASAINGIFDSQIVGGKRYDLAAQGRRAANATFFESHATDKSTRVIFGLDLTPLVADDSLDLVDYVCGFVHRFEQDVRTRIGKKLGSKEPLR